MSWFTGPIQKNFTWLYFEKLQTKATDLLCLI